MTVFDHSVGLVGVQPQETLTRQRLKRDYGVTIKAVTKSVGLPKR